MKGCKPPLVHGVDTRVVLDKEGSDVHVLRPDRNSGQLSHFMTFQEITNLYSIILAA